MDKSHNIYLHEVQSQDVSFTEKFKGIWDYFQMQHLKEELHLYHPGSSLVRADEESSPVLLHGAALEGRMQGSEWRGQAPWGG